MTIKQSDSDSRQRDESHKVKQFRSLLFNKQLQMPSHSALCQRLISYVRQIRTLLLLQSYLEMMLPQACGLFVI